MCDWFLLCNNPPTGTVRHPILGSVPICQGCADRLGLWFEATPPPVRPGQTWRDVDYRQYKCIHEQGGKVLNHRCHLEPRYLYIEKIGPDGAVHAISQWGNRTTIRKFRVLKPSDSPRISQGFRLVLEAP